MCSKALVYSSCGKVQVQSSSKVGEECHSSREEECSSGRLVSTQA